MRSVISTTSTISVRAEVLATGTASAGAIISPRMDRLAGEMTPQPGIRARRAAIASLERQPGRAILRPNGLSKIFRTAPRLRPQTLARAGGMAANGLWPPLLPQAPVLPVKVPSKAGGTHLNQAFPRRARAQSRPLNPGTEVREPIEAREPRVPTRSGPIAVRRPCPARVTGPRPTQHRVGPIPERTAVTVKAHPILAAGGAAWR